MSRPLGSKNIEVDAGRLRVLMAQANSNVGTAQFVPLTDPLESASWDGDAYATVSTATQLDLSAVFGAPAGIKAVLMRVACRDSGTWGTAAGYVILTPDSDGTPTAMICRCYGGDLYMDKTEVIPCDANGDLWYKLSASGGATATLDVVLQIWGYWI